MGNTPSEPNPSVVAVSNYQAATQPTPIPTSLQGVVASSDKAVDPHEQLHAHLKTYAHKIIEHKAHIESRNTKIDLLSSDQVPAIKPTSLVNITWGGYTCLCLVPDSEMMEWLRGLWVFWRSRFLLGGS